MTASKAASRLKSVNIARRDNWEQQITSRWTGAADLVEVYEPDPDLWTDLRLRKTD